MSIKNTVCPRGGDRVAAMMASSMPFLLLLLLLLPFPPDVSASSCPAMPTHTVGSRNYYLKVRKVPQLMPGFLLAWATGIY